MVSGTFGKKETFVFFLAETKNRLFQSGFEGIFHSNCPLFASGHFHFAGVDSLYCPRRIVSNCGRHSSLKQVSVPNWNFQKSLASYFICTFWLWLPGIFHFGIFHRPNFIPLSFEKMKHPSPIPTLDIFSWKFKIKIDIHFYCKNYYLLYPWCNP